jgi:hypothetical protein
MDDNDLNDADLASRLRRLEASTAEAAPAFDYHGLLERHGARQARARRRATLARGVASALVIAMIGVSVWRLDRNEAGTVQVSREPAAVMTTPEPRLVRADTYLALAALEEHIATIDDALNDARLLSPGGAEVARLERTRAELLDSYVRVRYADMVAANF